MKNKLYIIALLSLLIIAVPAVTYATIQEWKSTSPMQTSGSAYTPRITEVGAEYAVSEATTTESYSPYITPTGPRKGKITGPDTDPANESPIGDAILPLLAFALVFGGVIYFRRKRAALKG